MKVLNAEQLAELQRTGKVTQIATEQKDDGKSTTYVDVAALASLIVTSTQAIRTAQETNRQAMVFMKDAISVLAVQRPPVDAPAVYMPPFPEMPMPAKAWKFDIERNSMGLIQSVVATRIDEDQE